MASALVTWPWSMFTALSTRCTMMFDTFFLLCALDTELRTSTLLAKSTSEGSMKKVVPSSTERMYSPPPICVDAW